MSGLIIKGPEYAEDVCTLALMKPSLQEHFKVAYTYRRKKWQFDFSPTKCVVMALFKEIEHLT